MSSLGIAALLVDLFLDVVVEGDEGAGVVLLVGVVHQALRAVGVEEAPEPRLLPLLHHGHVLGRKVKDRGEHRLRERGGEFGDELDLAPVDPVVDEAVGLGFDHRAVLERSGRAHPGLRQPLAMRPNVRIATALLRGSRQALL